MHKAVRYACLAAIVGLLVPAFINAISVHQVDASSYDVRSVPTTIDLNDLTSSEIISYYKDLPSSSSEKQGTNLLKNLKPILKNNQKYFSYGGSATTAVWQAYEIVDRDWVKSPASAISGYNASTNKITGYVYGSSVSKDKGTNPYIHALYVNRNVTNQTTAWSDHDQDQWGINQEHIWAKSCGFQNTSPAAGARGDLMHLWAGNGKVNGAYHSNYYYGYVDKTKSYDDPAVKDNMPNLSGNLMGKSKTFPSSTYNVFEPQDSDKGDIARAIFYMVARYNNYSGSDDDGFDSGNPNLELVNELNWAPGTSYTSNATDKGQMGILQDLLEWNRIDPPDEWEIHRNNLLYNNFTNNRNPFIDFPEWAEYIWGKSEDGSYSSTPTGSADTGSDKINGFSDDVTPAVKHVSVSPTVLNLEAGNSSTLTATVTVTNGASTDVTWTSSDTSVATVTSNGEVTAVADGSATITVRSVFDNNKYATCSVTVGSAEPEPTSKNIVWTRSGTTDTVTSGYTLSAVKASSQNNYYQDKNSSEGLDLRIKKDSGNIWDNAPSSVSLTVKVGSGTVRDPLNNSVYAYYIDSNGDEIVSSETVVTTKSEVTTGKEYTITMPAINNVAGIKITHEKESSFNVRIYGASLSIADDDKTLTSIELDVENAKTEFDVGDTFEYDGLVVTANYDDDTSDTVAPTSVSTPDLTTAGTKEVTVTYTENGVTKTATYDITVSVAPTSASISPNGGTIDVGDTLQLTATVLPADAPDKSVEWSSSDEEVATISDSGLVTAVSEGTAIITVKTVNNKSSSCEIIVESGEEPETQTYDGSVTASSGAFEGWTSVGLGSAYSDGSAKFDGSGDNVYNYSLFTGLVSTNMVSLTVTINSKINGTPTEANAYKVDAVDKNGNVLQTLTKTGASVVTTAYGDTTFSFNSGLTNCAGLKITYVTKGGGNWGVMKISYSATYSTSSGPITSITASVNKDYHPGETISSSDVTVTANTGATISTFTLVGDGYMFTYKDAPSGGSTKTKEFTVKATPEEEELSCTLTVDVSRVDHADRPTSILTFSNSNSDFDTLSSSYKVGQTLTKINITFDVNGYVYNHKLSLSNGSSSRPGSFKNRTPINTGITNVVVAGATPDIQLSVTGSENDWVDLASKQSNVTYKYFKIFYKNTSATAFVNITSITITYRYSETATNISNYIMYEDTNGQCENKFDIASGYFNAMSSAERATFMTSQDYVIATARERFEDWAKHLGKTIEVENNDYVIKAVKPVVHIFNNEAHDNVSIIIIISIMGIGAIAGYFYFRKKKYQ